jgi:hypothetical protein
MPRRHPIVVRRAEVRYAEAVAVEGTARRYAFRDGRLVDAFMMARHRADAMQVRSVKSGARSR